jgi:hypothetical protein
VILVMTNLRRRPVRMMWREVAMDDVPLLPISRSRDVDVLGRKQSQAKDTKHRKASHPHPRETVPSHEEIIADGPRLGQTLTPRR